MKKQYEAGKSVVEDKLVEVFEAKPPTAEEWSKCRARLEELGIVPPSTPMSERVTSAPEYVTDVSKAFAGYFNNLLTSLPTNDGLYTVLIESSAANFVTEDGDVVVELLGSNEAVTRAVPLRRPHWWSAVDFVELALTGGTTEKEKELAAKMGTPDVEAAKASKAMGFGGFAFGSGGDIIPHRVSTMLVYTRNLGRLQSVKVSVKALRMARVEQSSAETQMRVARSVCRKLIREPQEYPDCQSLGKDLKDIAYQLVGSEDAVDKSHCQIVLDTISSEMNGAGFYCTRKPGGYVVRATRKAMQIRLERENPDNINKVPCRELGTHAVSRNLGMNPCADFFPEDGREIFKMSDMVKSDLRSVTLDNVYVIDHALNELYVAEFGGTDATSVQAQERLFT